MIDSNYSDIDSNVETPYLSKPLKIVEMVFADFSSAMKKMSHFILYSTTQCKHLFPQQLANLHIVTVLYLLLISLNSRLKRHTLRFYDWIRVVGFTISFNTKLRSLRYIGDFQLVNCSLRISSVWTGIQEQPPLSLWWSPSLLHT